MYVIQSQLHKYITFPLYIVVMFTVYFQDTGDVNHQYLGNKQETKYSLVSSGLFEEFCFYPSFPPAVLSYQGCLWAGSGPSLLLSKSQLIGPTNELFNTPHPVDRLVNHKYSAAKLGHNTYALSLKKL